MKTGIVFEIQRYCIRDGRGIRTCVFLKGCPLHCPWCHNPEGLAPCPQRDREGRLYGKEMTAEEIAGEVLRDREYYRLSGGGATLTGGEPLAQWAFCARLARTLRSAGVDVALETSGCVAPEHFRTVLPHLDRILFDVKHTDGQKLKETVGADADTVGENLRLAARAGIPVVLRSPLVAGFNLTEEHLRALGALARSLPAVERVELLPYHRLGEDKRRRLGLSCVEFREPTEAEKKFALAAVRREYPNAEVL